MTRPLPLLDWPVPAWERRLGTAVLRATGLFLLAMSVVAFVAPRQPNVSYRTPIVISLALATLAAVVVGRRVLAHRRHRLGRGRDLARLFGPVSTMLALLGGAAAVLVGESLQYAYGWDARVVWRFSDAVMATPPNTRPGISYLSRYPNNIPLLALVNLCHRVGAAVGLDAYTIFIVLNGMCVAVALLAVAWLVRGASGPGAGLVAQLLTFVLVGVSPWVAVPYTDVLATAFPVLGLALALAAMRRRSPAAALALGTAGVFVLAVGYVLKTTPLIVLLALGGLLVLMSLRRSWGGPRGVLTMTAAAALCVAVPTAGAGVADSVARHASGYEHARLDFSRKPPPEWWIVMGLMRAETTDGVIRYGAYSTLLVRQTSPMRGEQLREYSRARLEQRVQELGPAGLAAFLANKAAWTWGDGMFWAWGEGYDYRPQLISSPELPLTRAMVSWNHPSGAYYQLRAEVAQAIWLLLIGAAGVRLLRVRYRRELFVLALALAGLALFTDTIQGRSRYLFAFVPLVVGLTVMLMSRPREPVSAPPPST